MVSRQEQGFNPSVQKVAVAGRPRVGSGRRSTAVLRQAQVKVNPAYGSWNASQFQVDPPQAPSLPS